MSGKQVKYNKHSHSHKIITYVITSSSSSSSSPCSSPAAAAERLTRNLQRPTTDGLLANSPAHRMLEMSERPRDRHKCRGAWKQTINRGNGWRQWTNRRQRGFSVEQSRATKCKDEELSQNRIWWRHYNLIIALLIRVIIIEIIIFIVYFVNLSYTTPIAIIAVLWAYRITLDPLATTTTGDPVLL